MRRDRSPEPGGSSHPARGVAWRVRLVIAGVAFVTTTAIAGTAIPAAAMTAASLRATPPKGCVKSSDAAWCRVAVGDTSGSFATAGAAARIGDLAVIAGSTTEDRLGGDRSATVWLVEPSGATTTTTPFGSKPAAVGGLAADGDGVLAVGSISIDGKQRGAIWSSDSVGSAKWTIDTTRPDVNTFSSVAIHGAIAVAVGWAEVDGKARTFVARRTRAGAWQKTRALPAGAGDVTTAQVVWDPTNNAFVTAGVVRNRGKSSLAAWVSTDDGATWKRFPIPTSDTASSITLVATDTEGLIAAGADGDGYGTVWTSSDGETWKANRFLINRMPVRPVSFSSSVVLAGQPIRLGFTGKGQSATASWNPLMGATATFLDAYGQAGPLLVEPRAGDGDPWVVLAVPGSFQIQSMATGNVIVGAGGGPIPLGGPGDASLALGTKGDTSVVFGAKYPVRRASGGWGPDPVSWIGSGGSWRPLQQLVESQNVAGVVVDGDDFIAYGVGAPETRSRLDLNDGMVARIGVDGTIKSVSRLGGIGSQIVYDFIKFDGSWWAIVESRPEESDPLEIRAEVWSSDNLVDWTQGSGPFEDGRVKLQQVCAVNGQMFVVGTETNQGGATVPVAWIGDGNTWDTVKVGRAKNGSINGCAATSRGLVLTGTSQGRTVIWQGTLGQLSMKRFPPNVSLSRPVTAGDRIMIAGFELSGGQYAPTLWVGDGRGDWTRTDGPPLLPFIPTDLRFPVIADGRLFWPGRQGQGMVVWTAEISRVLDT